ncbi:putative cell wall-binding protein [Clostridium pascui]|uniref:cell wall-binding repeat-containing protein n=1 Tax=Clostridium pascui TaxID=46609 RepID=UPI0019566751|nr:cell wall-binding repeat-containing protein [Clostridium pascui]MBM7868548.1 putative cell wall-binding protein [Clostridium pascui]
MSKLRKRIGCLAVMSTILVSTVLMSANKVLAAPDIIRISGENRYKTSLQALDKGWSTAKNVVLVSGENFPDGLSAAPLAKKLDAPIILVNDKQINAEFLNKIKSLKTEKIFIIGGEGVISKVTENNLKNSLCIDVIRLSGQDRYETSINVANYMYSNFNMGKEVAVVSGENFPDAISMAPIAAIKGMPMILTSKSKVSDGVKTLLNGKEITKSYIIGGPAVISDNVSSGFPENQRIWGNNRYETNINIMRYFIGSLDITSIFIASGQNFPDALGGAGLVAKNSSPFFLVSSSLSESVKDYIYSFYQPGSPAGYLYVFGGKGVVSDTTVQSLITKKTPTGTKVTIGMTLNDVLKIMGEPIRKEEYRDNYRYIYKNNKISEYRDNHVAIEFTEKTQPHTVVAWYRNDDERISIGDKKTNAVPITLGSGISEIAAAVGTPNSITHNSDHSYWWYSYNSCLTLDTNNKVIGWQNNNNMKIYMGAKDPNAPGIKKGSTVQDVVRAMGSTNEINFHSIDFSRSMKYGDSYITIDKNGIVTGWINKGELKLAQ